MLIPNDVNNQDLDGIPGLCHMPLICKLQMFFSCKWIHVLIFLCSFLSLLFIYFSFIFYLFTCLIFFIYMYTQIHIFSFIFLVQFFYNNLTINRKDLIPWRFFLFFFKKKKKFLFFFSFLFFIFFLHLATMLQVQYLAKLYMAFEKRGIKDVHKSNFNITLWRQRVVNSTKIHFKYMFT